MKSTLRMFAYDAVARDGTPSRGTLEAESGDRACRELMSRGLYALHVASAGTARDSRRRLAAAELALGLRILADLLESGLPAGRTLQAFNGLAPRAWLPAVPHIQRSIREGASLAAALSDAPISIPPLVIGIAQAGEAGSGIGPAIRRAAELCESSAEMQSAVRAALAYPMLVAVAGAGAVVLLVTVVLPRFALILGDLGQSLPASTRLVLSVAAAAHTMLLPCAAGAAISGIAWRAWTASPAGRATWHRFLLAAPIAGSIRRAVSSARMAHALSAMLESDVPVSAALPLAARATGDVELEARLTRARSLINSGQPLSRALEDTDAATPTTIRLARAGEEAGRLPAMLAHAARIEQQRADRTIRTLVKMLEPTLLLTFASVVALIAAALLQAIYSVRPS
jgi:type II secretory pathway component PulF